MVRVGTRRYGWRTLVGDGLLTVALATVGVVGTAGADMRTDADVTPDGRAYALVLGAALALSVRRVWPLVTLAVCAAAASTYLVLGYPYGPILFVLVVAVYTAARHLPARVAGSAAGVALAGLLIHTFAGAGDRPGLIGAVPASAWVVVPFAAGVTIRLSREAVARDRADQLRRYADAERLRVAQEVHDVVAHGLAAINMQAEIALHLMDRRPEQAEPALAAISRTSREALDELRATLTAVRRAGPAPGEPGGARSPGDAAGPDDLAPTPGLARLDALIARMSDTGVPVRVETDGERRDLPAVVDLAAYRVIQEALTNVLRHAGTATATVLLHYRPGALVVEVTDTGRGASAGGRPGGHGVLGMRERVTALGGTFEAAPAPGGGFRVHAELPVEPKP
jgi:signal transduction histidine kinase